MKKITALLIASLFLCSQLSFGYYKSIFNSQTGRGDLVGIDVSSDVTMVGAPGQVLKVSGDGTWTVGATPLAGGDHSVLANLDYASSGHTGFLSTSSADTTYLHLDQTIPQSVVSGAAVFDGVSFNTNTVLTPSVAKLTWSSADTTLNLGLNSDVTLQIGQESLVRGVNKTGIDIDNGVPVAIIGAQGQRPKFVLAKGDSDTTAKLLGLTTQPIPNNQEGFVTVRGLVRGIDTDGYLGETWADGDILYVSRDTAGVMSNTPPTTPNHCDIVGVVVNANPTNGSILVEPSRHKTIDDLSDVDGTPLTTSGQFLVWDNTNQYFNPNYNISDYSNHSSLDSTYVPYAGAVSSVNLNSKDLTTTGKVTTTTTDTSIIQLNNSPTVGAVSAGKMYWDTDYKTASLNLDANTNLQIGQEGLIRVIAGENIADGEAVYLSTSSGEFPIAMKAIATAESTARVKGIATENITAGNEGFINNFGIIHGLNTSGWAASGDSVYLSSSTAGALTPTKPVPPNIQTVIGRVVVKNASNGSVYRSSSPNYPIDANQVDVQRAGASTDHSVQDWLNTYSAGMIRGGSIASAPTNQITVSAGRGFFAIGTADTDPIAFGDWASKDATTVTDARVTWVTAQYNSGSPQIVLIEGSSATDYAVPAAINYQDVFPLGYVTRSGTELYITNNPRRMQDVVGGLNSRFYNTLPLSRDEKLGGLILGETGTRNITMSGGALWDRSNKFTVSAIDTSAGGAPTIANSFSTFYRAAGSGFTETPNVTAWPNTAYDDGDGTLGTVASNRWANLWWYLSTEGYLAMVYGRAVYTSASAAALGAAPTTLPLQLWTHFRLIARTTFKGSDPTFTAIDSAFSNTFQPSASATHNNLSGLQGGGGATGEYYHLSSAQYSSQDTHLVTSSADATYVKVNQTVPQTLSGNFTIPIVSSTSVTVTNPITGSITGNAATVTTNANLLGPITSSGNTTAVALQTGTGSKFVMAESPALVTPNLGTPSALVVTNASGTASININGTVGATTPTTGAFTNVTLNSTSGHIIGGDGTTLPYNNVTNGSFETWAAGDSAAPTGWTLGGVGASVAKEATIIKVGTYSAKVTRSGADTNIRQQFDTTNFQSRTAIAGCWVWASVANRARLELYDGTTNPTSSYHTGDSTWQFLSIPITCSASNTYIIVYCTVNGGDTSAYFDGYTLNEGSMPYAFSEPPVLTASDKSVTVPTTLTATLGDITATNGNFKIGTADKGIDFSANSSAAGMTSELLNDYEIGTFTPTLAFSGGATGITYDAATTKGYYTKIGNQVTVWGRITLTSNGSSTGDAYCGGLPFAISSDTVFSSVVSTYLSGVTFANVFLGFGELNTTTFYLYEVLENGVNSAIAETDVSDAAIIRFTMQYKV